MVNFKTGTCQDLSGPDPIMWALQRGWRNWEGEKSSWGQETFKAGGKSLGHQGHAQDCINRTPISFCFLLICKLCICIPTKRHSAEVMATPASCPEIPAASFISSVVRYLVFGFDKSQHILTPASEYKAIVYIWWFCQFENHNRNICFWLVNQTKPLSHLLLHLPTPRVA